MWHKENESHVVNIKFCFFEYELLVHLKCYILVQTLPAYNTPWPNKNASILFVVIFQKLIIKNEKLFHHNNK